MSTGTYRFEVLTLRLLLALAGCCSVLSRSVPLVFDDHLNDPDDNSGVSCGEGGTEPTPSGNRRNRGMSSSGFEPEDEESDPTDTPPMLWFIMPGLMWILACCCGIWIMRLLCRESRALASEFPTGRAARGVPAESTDASHAPWKGLDCSIEASAQHPPKMLYRVDALRWTATPPTSPPQTPDDAQPPIHTDASEGAHPPIPPIDTPVSTDSPPQTPQTEVDNKVRDKGAVKNENKKPSNMDTGDADAPSIQHEAPPIKIRKAENPTCVICMEREGDHVLLPCGHGGYCSTCAHTLLAQPVPKRLCPICRAAMHAVAHVRLNTPVGSAGEVLEHSVACAQPCSTSRHALHQNSQRYSEQPETSWSRVLVWSN